MLLTRMRSAASAVKQPGWTLVELAIVLSVLAILVAIAYPAYTGQVLKARRADGRALLYEAAQRQQQFFSVNNAYATTVSALGMNAASDEGYYILSISGGQTWTLTATRVSPQTADTDCGDLTLNYLGVKGVANADLTAADCW